MKKNSIVLTFDSSNSDCKLVSENELLEAIKANPKSFEEDYAFDEFINGKKYEIRPGDSRGYYSSGVFVYDSSTGDISHFWMKIV